MALPLLVPIIGAALGGGIAFASGGAILTGMAVGWMVGSWLFPMGDQGFDPEAAQLQDVNQALRGNDIPILFGTNRVNSNVILRANFDSDKQSEKSGGFFGFGGKKVTTGYKYDIDLVLHYGIPYDSTLGFRTFAGWWDGEIFTDGGMVRLSTNDTGDHPAMTEGQARDEIQKFLNQTGNGERDLNFNLAHWSSGANSVDLWSFSDDLNGGQNVRWPETVWLGFRRIGLGNEPRIPAVSFEIGPPEAGGGTLTPGSADGNPQGANELGITFTDINYNLDENGNTYAWGQEFFRVISKSGTVLDTVVESGMVEYANAFTGVDSLFQFNSTLGRGFKCVGPILNGTKIAALMGARNDGGNFVNLLIIMDPWTSATTPVITGLVHCPEILNGYTRGGGLALDVAHLKRSSDPIIFQGLGELTLSRLGCLVFPSVDDIEAGVYDSGYGGSPEGLTSGTTATWSAFEVPRIEFVNPLAADRTNLGRFWNGPGAQRDTGWSFIAPRLINGAMKTVLYIPATRGVHEYHDGGGANPNAAYQNSISLVTSADQGALYYYPLDQHPLGPELTYLNVRPGSGYLGSKTWTFSMDTWTIATSYVLDAQDNYIFPFSDDFQQLDTSSNGGSVYQPHPFFHRNNDTEFCYGWMKPYINPTDTDNYDRMPIRIRLFSYNPNTGIFRQFGNAVNSETFFADSLGFVSTFNTDWSHRGVTFNAGTVEIGGFINGDFYNADWGLGTCGGTTDKVDLTPPEIIRHIMVNTIYGMGFDATRIDNTTWQAAVDYCNSESFKVSGIYRTSQNRAQYIEHLLAVYGGFLNWSQGVLKFGFVTGSDTVVRTLTNDHHVVRNAGDPPLRVGKGSRQDTFNQVTVNYLDRQLAYRKNTVQIADDADQDEFGVRARDFPGIFVMTEQTASKIAHRTLWAGLFARDTISGAFGWRDADLEPGDVVWLVDTGHPELQNGVRARLASIAETSPGIFTYDAIQEDPNFLNDPGFVTSETIGSPGNNVGALKPPRAQAAFELPKEFADANQIFVAWAPNTQHAGAKLYISASSDGAYSEILDQPEQAISVEIQENWGDHDCDDLLIDRTMVFNAASGHSLPSSASYAYTLTLSGGIVPEDRHDGNGIFLIGSEVVAVESLTVVGSNQYRAGRVYRGWGGTHIHAHSTGDVGFLLNQAVLFRDFTDAEIGKTFFFKAVPFNIFGDEVDITSVPAVEHTVVGGRYLPQIPTPIHTWVVASETAVISKDLLQLRTFTVNSGDDITFTWKDSARCSGFGFELFGAAGYGDFTTDTTSHNWTVVIVGSGGNDVRSTVVDTGWFVYTHSANVADNGAFGPFAIRVTPVNSFGNARRTQVRTCDVYERA